MSKQRSVATIQKEITAHESFISRADVKRDELKVLKTELADRFSGDDAQEQIADAKAKAIANFERQMAALDSIEVPESDQEVDVLTEESILTKEV